MALGIRFKPTDEELIRYLLKFVSCKNYSCDNIRLEDLYANKKPWEVFNSDCSLSRGDEDAKKAKYYFTKLKKMKLDGTRYKRTVIGGGWWKGLDGGKSVKYKGSKLGFKKSYRYQYGGDEVDNVVWTMKEYSLDEKILKVLRQRRLIQHEDVVLCYVKCRIERDDRHKELGNNYMPKEIASGNDVDGFKNDMLLTDQTHDLDYVTSSSKDIWTDSHLFEHNVFHELQQDQNNGQVINKVQNVEEMLSFAQLHNGDVASYNLEQATANFYDSCPVYQHDSFQLQQNQIIEQVNVQEQNLEELALFDHYHNDYVTSYSVEGTTNFQDYNVEGDTWDTFESTLAKLLMNNIGTQPQFPICIDESGYDYQLPQQIVTCPMAQGSTSMALNEGNIDAAAFVSDQWSTWCEEQVQNIEETALPTMLQSSDYCTEPTTSCWL